MMIHLFTDSRRVSGVAFLMALTSFGALLSGQSVPRPNPSDTSQVRETMKRATAFMVEKVSTSGGYVWTYLPDLSRRWGEMEARDTMIWIQPPGTPTMGHAFLDAYHATGDEYYYRVAEQVAGALISGQLATGGWHYLVDFAGKQSQADWYNTVGRNGWRLEEFQHDWGNATFDDGGTSESTQLLLRVYLEKRDPKYKPPLDKAIQFVIDSQHPTGAWPQRYPPKGEFTLHGKPDYTSFLTFNDAVTAGNIELLVMCYQALSGERFRGPIARGMNSFILTQQAAPQPGWSLQYTPDLKPAGARTYEPTSLATHTTAQNIEEMIGFYRLTGETKFLARIPEALEWLDAVRLPDDVVAIAGGRTHPTFIAIGTNKPLYVHRRGSNVVNGEYYVDGNPQNTIGHYSSFRQIDVSRLRQLYQEAKAMSPAEVAKGSPLARRAGKVDLPRYFTVRSSPRSGPGAGESPEDRVTRLVATLDERGRWLTELGSTSYPYRGDGPKEAAPGDFSRSMVGDESDTSPFRIEHLLGISTQAYIRNMGELIRHLDAKR
jgi:PelA/Pel-15E family pectate lyase